MLYEAGKGSRPRATINLDAYADNYDKIFGKKKAEQQEPEQQKFSQEVLDAVETCATLCEQSDRYRGCYFAAKIREHFNLS
jgi:hypothetical protein